MSTSVALGPFRLCGVLGRGGMGVVYRALDSDGIEVAIKTVSADPTAARLASFRREVRAVAGLDHPGIVYVFDVGAVSVGAASASDGSLEAGSPYLVMELCKRGNLGQCRPRSWIGLRTLLLALLDGLAHAHARGVVHRDLKPGNILRSGAREGSPGCWKLADFGIAHAVGIEPADAGATVGTVHYMAPEQVRSSWRDYGPWTDLYALGCVAWWCATGRRPFEGRLGDALLQAHLSRTPPKMNPRFPVPDDFEAWCRVLLAKAIRDRYATAADAAAALLTLGEATGAATSSAPDAVLADLPTQVLPVGRLQTLPPQRGVDGLVPRPIPILPDSWDHAVPPPRPMALLGAGLGLYGVRSIPLVGRRAERDRLWEILAEVHAGAPRGVLLTGPPGIGKSHLARWFCERGSEIGALRFLRVGCDKEKVDEEARQTVLRTLGGGQLDGTALRDCVSASLARDAEPDEDLVEWLTRWLGASDALGTAVGRATLRRLLEFRAGPRPAVLWLDGAGADACELAAELLAGTDARVLVLVTARTGEVEGACEIPLEPLPAGDHRSLIRELLRLEESLAARLEVHTEGNPQFAIELVGSWIQQGLLAPTASGFALTRPDRFELPASIEGVWAARLDELDLSAPERDALEVAAVLGMEVDELAWRALASDPVAPDSAREQLLARNLAVPIHEGRWRFTQRPFREAILGRAAEQGRSRGLHRRVARYLEARGDRSVELGLHLLEAGEPEKAYPLLIASLDELVQRRGYRATLYVLAEAARCLDAMGVHRVDQRRAEVEIRRAAMLGRSGNHHEAVELARRLESQAREHGWIRVLVSSLREQASYAMLQRDGVVGEALVSEALEWMDPADTAGAVRLQMYRSIMARHRGELNGSLTLALEAVEQATALGERSVLADAQKLVGLACLRLQDMDGTTHWMNQALVVYREQGNAYGQGDCLNALSHPESARGRTERALELLQQAAAAFEACGSAQVIYPMLNIGLLLLEKRDHAAARRQFTETRRRVRVHRRQALISLAEIGLAASAAGLDDWRAFDDHLAAAEGWLKRHPLYEAEIAEVLCTAADLAEAAGRPRRAGRAREVAELLAPGTD